MGHALSDKGVSITEERSKEFVFLSMTGEDVNTQNMYLPKMNYVN